MASLSARWGARAEPRRAARAIFDAAPRATRAGRVGPAGGAAPFSQPGRLDWRVPITRSAPEHAAFGWFLLVFFLLNFSQGVYPPLLSELVGALGLSFASAGLLGTAPGVARLLLDVPAGTLVERLGPSRMLHAGVALVMAGTILTATASALPALLLARGLAGLGSGMCMVIALSYLMRAGGPEHRTRRGNMLEAALIGGNAVSAFLAGSISVRAGWRWGFGFAAVGVAAGWLVATLRVMPGLRGAVPPPAPLAPAPARPHGPVASPTTFLAIYLAAFALAFGWAGAISTLAPLYGGQVLGLTPAVIGRTMATAYAIEVAVLVPVGWAADTFGRLRVLLPGFGVVIAGIVLLPLSDGAAGYTLACTLVIVGMTVWMIPASLLADRLAGVSGGRVIGLYRFTADLAMVVAPTAVGGLIQQAGFGVAASAIAVVVAACAGVAGALLAPRRRHR